MSSVSEVGPIEAANILYLFCVYVCIFTRDWFHILDQQMLSQGKCPCLLTRITRPQPTQNRKDKFIFILEKDISFYRLKLQQVKMGQM